MKSSFLIFICACALILSIIKTSKRAQKKRPHIEEIFLLIFAFGEMAWNSSFVIAAAAHHTTPFGSQNVRLCECVNANIYHISCPFFLHNHSLKFATKLCHSSLLFCGHLTVDISLSAGCYYKDSHSSLLRIENDAKVSYHWSQSNVCRQNAQGR